MSKTSQIRKTRERLNSCLAELNQIRPAVLLREDVLGRELDFREGLPCFERTLELFHRLSRCDLDLVPLARLKDIVNDAEHSLEQFHKILTFTGEGLENPRWARQLLIDDVRNSFERISANFGTVIQKPRRKRDFDPSSAAFAIGLFVLIFALVAVAYYSAHNGTVADRLLEAVHRI